MYRSHQFLIEVTATSIGKLLESLSRNNAVAELCSHEFNVAYCRYPEVKLPTPKPPFTFNDIMKI
jgi:hypothetical protein